MKKITSILTLFYIIPFALLVLALLFYSTIKSEYFEIGLENEIPTVVYDNPILHIIIFIVFLATLLCFSKIINFPFFKSIKKYLTSKYFRYTLVIYSGIISLTLLLLLKSNAYMDCLALIDTANRFNSGDWSPLTDASHSSYLYIYSFQIGFIAYLQLIFKLFGENNIWAVQFINCIGVMFLINALCKITDLVFKNTKISVLSKLLLALIMPLYINIVFVYGDVLGWSFAICGIYHVLNYCHNNNYKELILSSILFAFGYLLKTNIAIFIIAAIIIIFLNAFRQKKHLSLIFIIIIPFITILSSAILKNAYANIAGIEQYPKGTPAVCWIAMAMIDDDNFPEGWYNGYNLNTFKESGYDYEVAQDMAISTIKERLQYFSENPRAMVRFYRNKLIFSWIDPEFDSQIKLEWSTRHVEDLSPLALSLIYGTGRNILFTVMNELQFTIFAGILAELLYIMISIMKKKKENIKHYMYMSYIILPIFGGMLFHLIWETQPRYMIGYYSMLFPIAAAGLVHMVSAISKIKQNSAHK